ncbi:carnitine O-palmitoyltransferase 2, mitochondrial-like [Macrobrachium nipponense]|uniref:carnitine O-palmitoyltransferase 2, mitochondrial-like n=1 Tax=Macrobrachium nipponense TaxID=159736 RepID=UPI0030C85224
MLITKCRDMNKLLPHVHKNGDSLVVRCLSLSPSCSSTKEEYQYVHKSKVPTMHFQKSLLRLPIPDLEKTCSRYLRSQKALLSDDEYKVTENIVNQFKTGPGSDLDCRAHSGQGVLTYKTRGARNYQKAELQGKRCIYNEKESAK